MRSSLFAIACVLSAPQLLAQQPKQAFGSDRWHHALSLGDGTGLCKQRAARGHLEYREATEAALLWLKRHQALDGCWPSAHTRDATVAVTSAALLAMLSDGSTMRAGPWKQPIKMAVRWLRDRQKPSGAFARATGPHLLASLAMTEAYVLSNYKLIKKNAVRGLDYAASLRAEDGGWRAAVTVERSNPALTVWGTALLGTAEYAGLIDDKNLNEGILEWLCGPQARTVPDLGVLGAEPPLVRSGELAFDQMAANAFTFYWLKTHGDDGKPTAFGTKAIDRHEAAMRRIRKIERTWQKDPKHKLSITEWFASSHAMQQAGDTKAVAKIRAALVAAQIKRGDHKGTWDPIGVWGEAGGRAWTTAMAAMTLAAPYRYSKIRPK